MPNVGKSTLFNALTNKKAEASNYPFCTIDPNVGVVSVPDERLEKIAAISKPKKIVPTIIEFTDIAGLVKGAHTGEGLGNKFLTHIRECDAICEVVRDFRDDNIIHVNGKIDPEGDKETINMELVFADLSAVEKSLAKTEREAKSGDKDAIKLKGVLQRIKAHLEAGKPARSLELDDEEMKMIKSFSLLTIKPIIYVMNVNERAETLCGVVSAGAETGVAGESPLPPLANGGNDGEILALNIKLEEEIAALSEEEQKEYIKELGLEQSGLDKLIKASYKLLGLLTFFTTGSDETRAWTVKAGSKAPQAAGAIHTDFEKGFIRAEVIGWEKFIEAGSEAVAREKGWIRTEGKEYVMRDGDICNFLFNK